MTTIPQTKPEELAVQVQSLVVRSDGDKRPVVVMTCGIAGSGKTSLAKALLQKNPSMHRLSIDEIVASQRGIHNVDYTPDKYKEYQNEADAILRQSLQSLLGESKADIILDRSFYAKEDRDEFKQIIHRNGGRWVLIYLKVPSEILWDRIRQRRANGINANSALEISTALFDMYVKGFEHPKDEGEIVVEYTI